MSNRPIHIAILEADTPLAKTQKKYGSYGGVFKSLLEKAANASNIPHERLKITGWDVVNGWDVETGKNGEAEEMGGMYDWKRTKGYPPMESIDAILITGSRRWIFLQSQVKTWIIG